MTSDELAAALNDRERIDRQIIMYKRAIEELRQEREAAVERARALVHAGSSTDDRIRDFVIAHAGGNEKEVARLRGLESTLTGMQGQFALLEYHAEVMILHRMLGPNEYEQRRGFFCGPLGGEQLYLPPLSTHGHTAVVGLPLRAFVEFTPSAFAGDTFSKPEEGPLQRPSPGLAFPEGWKAEGNHTFSYTLYVGDERVKMWLAENLEDFMHLDLSAAELKEPLRFGERMLADIAERCGTLVLVSPDEEPETQL